MSDTEAPAEEQVKFVSQVAKEQAAGKPLSSPAARIMCGFCSSAQDGVCKDRDRRCPYVLHNGFKAAYLYMACSCVCNIDSFDPRVDVEGVHWDDVKDSLSSSPSRKRGSR